MLGNSFGEGTTVYWTKEECEAKFGKAEFAEIEQGYAPHIVVVEVSEEWARSHE